ncbi:hypothetical protein BD560DRAFT_445000 [Blakeslea trispora]|nr:hypothetical protein BD560DRAFT_445000 [Blakeslea trispora]
MAQTLQLPVLSLAMPSVHNMDSMDAYSLSCMWNSKYTKDKSSVHRFDHLSVFSKCKNNLENGRRLENMSWRLWYRETTLKEKSNKKAAVKEAQSSSENTINPNRINEKLAQSKNQSIGSILGDQKISKASKDMNATSVTSFDTDTINDFISNIPTADHGCSNLISHTEQAKGNSKFFIDDDSDDEFDDEDMEHDDSTPSHIGHNNEFEDLETGSDCESFETFDEPKELLEDNRIDEAAFMIEFRKRSPCANLLPKGQSLLTTLLRMHAQPDQVETNHVCYPIALSEDPYHPKFTHN